MLIAPACKECPSLLGLPGRIPPPGARMAPRLPNPVRALSWDHLNHQEASTMPKQALIMIDMQRGFLDSASPLCIPSAEATVPACAALIDRCHAAGIPVIYAVRHYRSDGLMWKSRARSRQPAASRFGGLRRAPVGRVSGRVHRPKAGLCARKAAVLSVFPHRARPYFAAARRADRPARRNDHAQLHPHDVLRRDLARL